MVANEKEQGYEWWIWKNLERGRRDLFNRIVCALGVDTKNCKSNLNSIHIAPIQQQ
jgi:hypothetical protein